MQKARGLVRSGKFLEGLNLYATLAGQFPPLTGEYGSAAAHSGDFALADQLWGKFRRLESRNARAHTWLGLQYGDLGLHAKSRECFREATALEPGSLEMQVNLAVMLTRAGGPDEARAAIDRCLSLNPRSEQARFLEAQLDRRENRLAEAEQRLRGLLTEGLALPQIRYACHAELADVLDRTGRFDEAMAQREQAKSQARESFNAAQWNESFARHEQEANQVKALPRDRLLKWDKSFPREARKSAPSLVFLCGSARSGTTLMEKILDANPGVAACDESQAFGKIQPQVDIDAPAIPAPRLNAWREMYLRSLATALGDPAAGKTLVDKNPSQTGWLPAFLRLFPELRVLIALRDPRDVILSLYFQNQANTNCLTLEQHARVYRSVMEIWLAVREWEGLRWLETRYEDLVADLAGEGGRITSFLGLAWHENQAQFHQHNREKTVLSNNYSSVTQPIYARAVGRWRHYEKYIAPVLPILEPFCELYGYGRSACGSGALSTAQLATAER